MCGTSAFKEAHKILLTLVPRSIAMASGAGFDEKRGLFFLEYCGEMHEISLVEGTVTRCGSPEEVSYNDRTLILQYLAFSSGLPPRGRWLSFLDLPEGILHYAPFQKDALSPLAVTFGADPGGFLAAAARLKGAPAAMGNVAAVIPALPKIPLAVILWLGDDEFPAKAVVLFDSVSPTHLSTAALWVLGVEVARKLIGAAGG
ncbi:MAG: DUF3786 domain-containing protein [Eubacteriales bacterium]